MLPAGPDRPRRRRGVSCDTDTSMSDAARHLTVIGEHAGEYVIDEQLADGRLVIRPQPYPSVIPDRPGRPLTGQEFDAFLAEHRPHMLPPDDEG